METMEMNNLHATFTKDGVVRVKQALDADWLKEAEAAFNWSLANQSATSAHYNKETESGRFYVDTANPESLPVYRKLLENSLLADLVASAWGSDKVWYAFEQIFYKEGGSVRSQRTGWHQDSSYLSFDGEDLAVMWITFDALPKEAALELVRCSHRGPLYEQRGVKNDTGRPTVPHIEAARDQYDIVSWPIEPGDVLIFHPAMLHGGGGTEAGKRRRTLSLRFFGEDVKFIRRPQTHDTPPQFLRLNEQLNDGDPFRHPDFLQLR
ncbi:MAG: phytanoyl-CoA dioxygenase family protein [Sulfuricaulis sp.]|nr:phytanoyl-CoA dioxygenase family protein [Sulfuricaulis sp.]